MELTKTNMAPTLPLSQIRQPFMVEELLDMFDVFYVCFDEPNRKENWQSILQQLPQAKKVEGVVGFDKALKTCAEQSETPYFFVIDGDNRLLPDRFVRSLNFDELKDHWVLSWSSMNPVNGLSYGNGGLKLWPKDVALSIETHESAGSDDDKTDYCFIADYFMVDDYCTETVMNNSFTQAFRAGFREGVKMSLAWGKQVELNKNNFEEMLGPQNRMRLQVWCEVGDDCLNGVWGILGARLGLIKNVIEKFDYQKINSYDWIDQYLVGEILPSLGIRPEDVESLMWERAPLDRYLEELAGQIQEHLPLALKLYSPIESMEFKKQLVNPPRSGLLGRNPRC